MRKKTGTIEKTSNKWNKNEIKNETKKKLNMLDDQINSILEKFYGNLTTLELRYIFCEKPCNFKKEK